MWQARATGPGPASGTATSPTSRDLAGEAVQDLHRRDSADRRADGRDRLPAVSHASRSCGVAGVARAVCRGRSALSAGGRSDCTVRRARRWWSAASAWITPPRSSAGATTTRPWWLRADGARVGRYDKIHLVPFGEYIPFQQLLFFAHKLTGRVVDVHARRRAQGLSFCRTRTESGIATASSSATRRSLPTRCASLRATGAEVLVNISDDGWYGDTSAPWQHLNMARMRAIENRRWILRDTNNGITAAIDPYGRVRQSIPRHQADALPAQLRFPRRRHLLHRARRRLCVGVCHT